MNHLLLFTVFVVVTVVCPSMCFDKSQDARILLYENENIRPTGYKFKFETSDGIRREERGEISNPESNNAILRVRGSYSYITPDEILFTVRYIADDQGYRPEISQVALKDIFLPVDGVPINLITSLQAGNTIG